MSVPSVDRLSFLFFGIVNELRFTSAPMLCMKSSIIELFFMDPFSKIFTIIFDFPNALLKRSRVLL